MTELESLKRKRQKLDEMIRHLELGLLGVSCGSVRFVQKQESETWNGDCCFQVSTLSNYLKMEYQSGTLIKSQRWNTFIRENSLHETIKSIDRVVSDLCSLREELTKMEEKQK